jgi:hypothetical protein
LKVLDNKNTFEKAEKFTRIVIEKNSSKLIRMNEEIQMGLCADFAHSYGKQISKKKTRFDDVDYSD